MLSYPSFEKWHVAPTIINQGVSLSDKLAFRAAALSYTNFSFLPIAPATLRR
jgi:hypothetical protein